MQAGIISFFKVQTVRITQRTCGRQLDHPSLTDKTAWRWTITLANVGRAGTFDSQCELYLTMSRVYVQLFDIVSCMSPQLVQPVFIVMSSIWLLSVPCFWPNTFTIVI